MIILSMLEPALLVIILAVALTMVARRLNTISEGLGTLGGMLATVESQHLRPLQELITEINGPLNTICVALPGIASKAALVVRKARGG
jgi:type IV secretory pathway VirB2 component (pilin)